MLTLLAKIIPLDLASTLSPGLLALVIVILGGKNHSKLHVVSLFCGTLLVGISATFIGFALATSVDTGIKQNLTESIIDIVLGIFLIIYGLKVFFSHERKITLKEESDLKIFKWFGLGLVITITNFDALFLNFTAAKEVGNANVTEVAKIFLLGVNLFFFTLPITLPLFLYCVFPNFAGLILAKINRFVLKYSRYIILILFVVFGLFLLWRGVAFFI